MVEFADVARPSVGAHRIERRGIEAGDRLAVAGDVRLQEMLGEQLDVLAAVAQRWEVNLDRVQPEEQILAEFSGGDLGVEIGVGRGDEPDIRVKGPR